MAKNRVTRFFWGAWCLNKKCREWSNPYKYGILAKTNEAISRKWQKKMPKTPNLDTKWPKKG